jgi:hypothetical protein
MRTPASRQHRRIAMRLTHLGALAAVAVFVAAGASAEPRLTPNLERAQLPPPFGAPGPIPGLRSCSPQHQRLLKLQLEGMRQLQRLSRSQGETLCASIDGAAELGVDKFLEPKALRRFLTPEQRDALGAFGIDLDKVDVAKIMRLLGVDLSRVDLRQLRNQCRQGQGELERFASSEIGRLENELTRCDERI